jgi:hypothetical protein
VCVYSISTVFREATSDRWHLLHTSDGVMARQFAKVIWTGPRIWRVPSPSCGDGLSVRR